MKRGKIKVGDAVTCRVAVPAHHSWVTKAVFQPGMVGTVVAIAPKVRIVQDGPDDLAHDTKGDFLYVEYDCPETGKRNGVGLNFCNAVRHSG